jgi:cytoskeletal protein CcmA (bactofilin family)
MKLVNGYLGQDLQLEGSISSKDSIRIDGSYVGSIISKHMVIVGSSGKVNGRIGAPVIQVDGWVEGDLKATKLVEGLSKARVKGKIITPVGGIKLKIGSVFIGSFIMKNIV